ncbi:MAG: peptidase S10 [Pseudomonadota bacterium]
MFNRFLIAALFAVLSFAVPAGADDHKGDAGMAEPHEPYRKSVTRQGTFGGERVSYEVVLSETVLSDDGEETAAIFSTAYLRSGVSDYERRPITFFFNGGPGSSSVWLHMGAFGPKRVAIPSDAKDDGAPPFPIVDNPHALLDVTDIVFIDPVGTGFSKALGDAEPDEFWGVHEDAASIAQFIRQWISENGRWNSPKFLGGESYGTLRTAAVVRELEGSYNDVSLNGLILVSTVLDMYHDVTGQGNELAWPILLPTMAATAWYHEALDDRPDDLEAFLEEVRAFAEGPYMAALMKGNRLDARERAAVRADLARFTGLSEDYLENANLRVSLPRFQKELLRDRGLTVGRLDSRYTGVDYDRAGDRPDQDPSFVAIDGAYTAALNSYFRSDLNLEMDREYEIISGLGRDWNWDIEGPGGGRFMFNVAPYIGTAMRHNSGLRVFNAAGYYDFATPFFSAEFSLTRNGIVPDRVVMKYYPAGHMMYVHEPSLEDLNEDIRAFIRGE